MVQHASTLAHFMVPLNCCKVCPIINLIGEGNFHDLKEHKNDISQENCDCDQCEQCFGLKTINAHGEIVHAGGNYGMSVLIVVDMTGGKLWEVGGVGLVLGM